MTRLPYRVRAQALDKLGKYQEALTWYDKLWKLILMTRLPYRVGAALDKLGKYQEALTWYDKALG